MLVEAAGRQPTGLHRSTSRDAEQSIDEQKRSGSTCPTPPVRDERYGTRKAIETLVDEKRSRRDLARGRGGRDEENGGVGGVSPRKLGGSVAWEGARTGGGAAHLGPRRVPELRLAGELAHVEHLEQPALHDLDVGPDLLVQAEDVADLRPAAGTSRDRASRNRAQCEGGRNQGPDQHAGSRPGRGQPETVGRRKGWARPERLPGTARAVPDLTCFRNSSFGLRRSRKEPGRLVNSVPRLSLLSSSSSRLPAGGVWLGY